MAIQTVKREVPDQTLQNQDNDKKMEIYREQHPVSPREMRGDFSTMATAHSRYDIGDKSIDTDMFNSLSDYKSHVKEKHDVKAILPLYLYDHSGLRIQTGRFNNLPQGHARFDTSKIGFIYITQEQVERLGIEDKTTKELEEMLDQEVQTYDAYLRGDTYRYELKDGEDTVDSCTGFIGSLDQELREHMFDTAGEDPDNYKKQG